MACSATMTAFAESQLPARSDRRVGARRSHLYGGSRKARSNGPPALADSGPSAVASRRHTLVMPVSASVSTFCRTRARLWDETSTNRQYREARESASSPMAPVPAKRSITRAPSRENPRPKSLCSRMLNTAWRTLSDVGRTLSSLGPASTRPPKRPPVMRTGISSANKACTCRCHKAAVHTRYSRISRRTAAPAS